MFLFSEAELQRHLRTQAGAWVRERGQCDVFCRPERSRRAGLRVCPDFDSAQSDNPLSLTTRLAVYLTFLSPKLQHGTPLVHETPFRSDNYLIPIACCCFLKRSFKGTCVPKQELGYETERGQCDVFCRPERSRRAGLRVCPDFDSAQSDNPLSPTTRSVRPT